jgi:hypothetical protein
VTGRSPLLAALALSAACHCGGDGPAEEAAQVGDACSRQADCGSALLCWSGACAERLPAAPTCATPGAAPALLAGVAVVAEDPGPGVCTFPVRDVVLPSDQVQDLGERGVGEEVSFTVPDGTWSITVVEQVVDGSAPETVNYRGSELPNAAVPDDVRMPDGRTLFDDTPASIPTDADHYPDYTGFLSVHFGAATPGTGVATFPNATPGLELVRVAGELPPGTWTLKVNDWAYECATLYSADCTGGSTEGRYRVHVITRGPPASTGRLDLDVYLATSDGAGGPRLTAAQAAASPALARAFGTLASYLGQAGLCLDTVTFHDLPDWARQRFASTEYAGTGCDEVSQLFRLSLVPSPNVQLFLVDELVSSLPAQPGTLLGVDGAIPGPSGAPGGPTSGAVASLGDLVPCSGPISLLGCEADLLGYVGAHEVGHWLGLFHTTEATGTQFDPLEDTPRCPCNRCASPGDRSRCDDPAHPAFVFTDRCSGPGATCAGASNLMFWVVTGSSQGRLTTEQSEVARLNPAVR